MGTINVQNLNKSYYIDKDEYKVLKDLSVSFNSGEFVAIYGESGSGKSTLMNVLGGLDIFQSGDITIDEDSITEFTSKSMDYYRNRKIGFVFQEFNLLESLKVIDNVTIPMSIAGLNEKQAKKRAKELLIRVGLKSQIKKKVNQLSGGQKQRVAIARALANDPEIILADEPTGALDSKTTVEILELLQSISKEGKLIVAITHSEKVSEYASRVVHLVNGKIENDNGIDSNFDKLNKEVEFKKDYSKLGLRKAFKIAKANLFSKKVRTFFVALGVSLGITGSIVITSISEDMINQVDKQISGFTSDPSIVNGAVYSEAEMGMSSTDDSLLAIESLAKDFEGYVEANPERFLGKFIEFQDKEVETQGFEEIISADYSKNAEYSVSFGENVTGSNQAVFTGSIDRVVSLAEENGATDLIGFDELIFFQPDKSNETYIKLKDLLEEYVIGSEVEVEGIDGSIEKFTIVGSLDLTSFSLSATQLFAPYSLNKELFDYHESNGYKSMYFVTFDSEKNATAFIEKTSSVQSLFDGVDTGYKDYKFINIDNRALLSFITTIVNLIRNVFLVLIGVSLVVSVFMVNVIVYISTIERKIEIGTLRAIGAKKKDIQSIFISEGIILGLISFVLAVIGSFMFIMLANIANYLLVGGGELMMFTLSMPYLLLIALLVIVVMFLASLVPAIKASRQNPIDALREE